MNVDYKLIGSRIKNQRTKQGLTQENMAELLGVSIGYVSQVERGITKISLDLLGAISSILNCDIESLISESAIKSENYLDSAVLEELHKLNNQQRKLALDFIKLLHHYN